jgi:ADP-ribose pyrophosphatase
MRILGRQETRVSPWVRVVAKTVERVPGHPPEVFHCVAQADYVTIVARTPDGRIPIVGQYRPAVEAYTWELPAGLLDANETPLVACRRELKEETGLEANSISPLGTFFPDTGRLENRIHVFWVDTSDPEPGFIPEAGMALELVTATKLREYVRSGRFAHQLHLGALAVAVLNGHDVWA